MAVRVLLTAALLGGLAVPQWVSAAPAGDAVARASGPVGPGEPALPPQPVVPVSKPEAAKAKAPPLPSVPVKLSADPRPTFGPETFVATMNAAERYRAIVEVGGWPAVSAEATRLKAGEGGPGLAELRARLAAEGDLAEAERSGLVLDEALAAALRRFQLRHGLEETGLVGPRTLAQLNVTAATRLRQLQASSARLLGSRFAFGDRYVAVNIPSASVEAVERGAVARRYVAVVGKPDRASPTVETRVTSINLNPTWTVPVSLIRKDIIPHVRKDPGYLARMKIRLFDAQGQEVDPATIDWSTGRAVNYMVRQDAGIDNSLGEVRIDMPNRHAVYMHDTPSKRLFARDRRAQSSGCVRVSGVKELAAWLLEGTPGPAGAAGPSGAAGSAWGGMEIETAIATGSRVDVRLTKPVPVAWVYLTGWSSPDGTVHFRDDVYGLDEPQAAHASVDTGAAPRASGGPRGRADDLSTSSVAPAR